MSTYKYLNKITRSGKKLFTSLDIQEVLDIRVKRTLEDIIKRFIDANILIHLEKGKYLLADSTVTDFEIAQFLYSPSYISFETALNYHGILSQFPTETTSATTKTSAQKIVAEKAYSYSKISTKLFTGYYRERDFLIADPEKALFDQLYMISKGLKTEQYLDEMDYTSINKKALNKYIKLIHKGLGNKISEYLEKY